MFKSPVESSRADGCARREPRSAWVEGLDLLGDIGGVIPNPADQRGASGVLPGQSEEIQAGGIGHAAAMNDTVVIVEDRRVDPGVIGAEPGGPQYGVRVELAAVAKPDR